MDIEKKKKEEVSKLFKKIQKSVNKAMVDYRMVEDGDVVLVGLSGGKDSIALLEFLGARAKIYKPSFKVKALHVSVKQVEYKSDLEYMRRICVENNVEFFHEEISVEEDRKEGRTPCFLCSWNRRKILFEVARREGCNKVALGHHQDDMLETLLMNQIFQGAYATMPPVLKMTNFELTIIRPLALVRERLLVELAEERRYQKQEKLCPFEKVSNRPQVREILEKMEALNPNAAGSLWGAMKNIQREYLP